MQLLTFFTFLWRNEIPSTRLKKDGHISDFLATEEKEEIYSRKLQTGIRDWMDIRNREEASKASSRKTKTYGIDIEGALDAEPHSKECACSLLLEPSSPKRLTYRGSPHGFLISRERKEDYILVQRKSSVKVSLHPAHCMEWISVRDPQT